MTGRTAFTRKADRGSHDRLAADAILAEALVGHLGFADATGAPMVLPVAIARDGDRVLFHGSTGSRLFRTLATGVPACLTVTLLDGLVLARSAFESSMNYRSLVVVGSCEVVSGDDQWHALQVITEHLTPGRWAQLRPMTAKEVAATMVLALPLTEFSVKARTGGTDEPLEDRDWPTWAGQLPVVVGTATPIPQPDLPAGVPAPIAPRGLGGPGAL
ncbi:MAG TPA: pyridoxamine 5'-phosphate oxidase family protein [Candidatus Nanopelagicales bacterium]